MQEERKRGDSETLNHQTKFKGEVKWLKKRKERN